MRFVSWLGEYPLSWKIPRILAVQMCDGITNRGCGNTVPIVWLRTTCFGTLEKLATNTRKGAIRLYCHYTIGASQHVVCEQPWVKLDHYQTMAFRRYRFPFLGLRRDHYRFR